MALEVTFDLKNELRDLDYLSSSAYFISLSLKSLFSRGGGEGGRKETKLTCRPACSFLAAGKNLDKNT